MSSSFAYVANDERRLTRTAARADSEFTAEAATSLNEVAGDWIRLERSGANATVFQTYSWCSAWLAAAEQVGRPEQPVFIRVRRRGIPVLIWPLCRTVFAGCRTLHALGEPATQYCDALVASGPGRARALARAWNVMVSRGDVDLLSLRRIRNDAAIATLPAIAAWAPSDSAPFIELERAAEIAFRSGKRRRELGRCLRKLSALGEVAFEVVQDPAEKIRAVDRLVKLKRVWMRQRALWSGGYTHPAADAFTRFLASDPAFTVFVLRVGSEAVAIEAGYVLNGTYWCLTRSYDPRFALLSPSHLLAQRSIDHWAALGLSHFDFLAPAQPYKMDWSTGAVGVRDALVPVTLRGRLFARAVTIGRPALKRILGYASSLAKQR
jgi:CelD/BcsL family acetyltransferase involved in cellulose biosynthesis